MQNIIEAIYDGELSPIEQIVAKDSYYREYMERQCEVNEKLQESLTGEQRHLFEDYLQRVNVTDSYIQRRIFCQGFKIGAQIILETDKI